MPSGSRRSKRNKRRELAATQRDLCSLCGEVMRTGKRGGSRAASIDHFIPLSRGGTHTADNFVASHRDCNTRKGNALPGLLAIVRHVERTQRLLLMSPTPERIAS